MRETEEIRTLYSKLTYEQLVVLQTQLQEQQTILKGNDIWTKRAVDKRAMLKKKLAVINSIFTVRKAEKKANFSELCEVTSIYIDETLSNYGIFNPSLARHLKSKLIARGVNIASDYPYYKSSKGFLATFRIKLLLIKQILTTDWR
jgi:hypothetical protein